MSYHTHSARMLLLFLAVVALASAVTRTAVVGFFPIPSCACRLHRRAVLVAVLRGGAAVRAVRFSNRFFLSSCLAVLASRPSSNPAGSAHGVAHTVLRGLRAVTPLTARPGEFSPVNKFSSAFAAHARAQLASPCLK